jgi:hypothetical protein
MAVQYAVAYSGSIVGVGSIAGPGWGCADGSVSQAINNCMCGRQPVVSKIGVALALAASAEGDIDRLLPSGRPRALRRSYVFHSAGDRTVVPQSGKASIDFLTAFIGEAPVVDWGNPRNGSHNAGHGIVSPNGTDSCSTSGNETAYVRRCGAEDTAGKLFLALYGQGLDYDVTKRVSEIPMSEVWQFDQQRIVRNLNIDVSTIAADRITNPFVSPRRKNLDLARTGYLYVPPSCRHAASKCRVHIALHGCKQNAGNFAITAGYNNWAEYYKVIVVYPAVAPGAPQSGEVCRMTPVHPDLDHSWVEPNSNGCWDWWGYLNLGFPVKKHHYLTKNAPQMRVIERIIAEVTRPIQ